MNITKLTIAEANFLTGTPEQQVEPLDALLAVVAPASRAWGSLTPAIPAHMLAALRGYISHGIRPGGFLAAVVCNDLRLAIGYADQDNVKALPAFVAYLQAAPSGCWGSREKMELWIHRFDRERRERMAEAQEPWEGAGETDSEVSR